MVRGKMALVAIGLILALAEDGIAVADPPPRLAPQRNPLQGNNRPPAGKPAADNWRVIYLGQGRIGYSRTLTRPVTVDGKTLLKTESEMHLKLKRFGQPLQMETRQETDELLGGELVAFVFEIRNPPAAPTRSSGKVQGNQLVGETTVDGMAKSFSMGFEAGAKSSAYLDRLTSERRFRTGENLSFRVFFPEQMQVSDVRLSAGRRESVTLLDGRRHTLTKLSIVESILPQSPTYSFLNERGEELVSKTDLFGQTLTTYKVSADEALKEIAGGELDIALNTLVNTTVLPQAHQFKRAVYRIKMRGEDPTPFFPNYSYQKVIRKGIDECEVTVRNVAPETSRRSARIDRQYLASSRYLQTNDPDVLIHVDLAARHLVDPAQVAVAMEQYVEKNLERKDFSTALASAAEVAKSLQGDCTEHAVLLAAMLRARNIPSRIAVGLVYFEPLSSFVGHMWTEAFLGDHWVPLDATLGKGAAGMGAAHIKLADSSFADNAPNPMLTFLPLVRVLGRIELTVVETSGAESP